MRQCCVVHLARAANGLEPFQAFLDSYRAHDPGVESELILVFKGFVREQDAQEHLRLARGVVSETRFYDDRGFDLNVYFRAARELARERYCFVNSFSTVQCGGWLAALAAALDRPGVGASGATGSWASNRAGVLYDLGLPSYYRGVFPDRPATRAQMHALERDRTGGARVRQPVLLRKARTGVSMLAQLAAFPDFPAYHLRTNAFMIDADVLRRLHHQNPRRKFDAWRLESGRRGLTSQLDALGLRALLADAQGLAYERQDWPESNTFWQGAQQGLIVADNQTRTYACGDSSRRALLAGLAWGHRARPAGV